MSDQTTDLAYLAGGDHGPALVFLHGWGSFKEIWLDTLTQLAPHGRGYALDLPGHGGSPLGRTREMAGVAGRVAGTLDALGLRDAVLVGHSMGGNVAVELALARPDLVARLVLVDPAVLVAEMLPGVRPLLERSDSWGALRLTQAAYRLVARVVPGADQDAPGSRLQKIGRRARHAGQQDPEGLHRLFHAMLANDLRTRLPAIRQPTVVIGGTLDALVPPELTRRTAELIPGAGYVPIPRAAHNPMDEQPAAFVAALFGFVGLPPQANAD